MAGLINGAEALLPAGRGGGFGAAARRFFASGSSIERPCSSTCSARAVRSASARSAGSTVACTKPRTGMIPALTRGSPTASSAGRSPKAVRRTPSRVFSTKGSSSVPAMSCAPSAVWTTIGVEPLTPKVPVVPSWKPNSRALSLSMLSSSPASRNASRNSSGAGFRPSTSQAASVTCLRIPGTSTTQPFSRTTSVAGP